MNSYQVTQLKINFFLYLRCDSEENKSDILITVFTVLVRIFRRNPDIIYNIFSQKASKELGNLYNAIIIFNKIVGLKFSNSCLMVKYLLFSRQNNRPSNDIQCELALIYMQITAAAKLYY